ncbi:D-2-hydroxyglutarate dehydrogenase, mitochondrial [Chamberlinius hualienensis]
MMSFKILTSRTYNAVNIIHRTLSQVKSIKRGNYSILNEKDVNYFQSVLKGESHRVITDSDDLEEPNTDRLKHYKGKSKVLLKPKTTDEVSEILSYCNRRRLSVCPQGGNTGLVGGSVPVFDEIILSTSLMNQIISIDKYSGAVVCQSGCILETLDNELAKHGLVVPLDLGSRGSCQIGGNVATNAGGIRYLRFGSLHGSVLGLEVVLADGTVLDCLSVLRKDNTGFDVKQLFIGSEGTLGIITKVAILGVCRPTSSAVAFMATNSFENVLKLKVKAGEMLGEILSAFEFMDQESLMCTQKAFQLKTPLDPITNHDFYVLLEASGSNQTHDDEKLHKLVETSLDSGLIEDAGIYSLPSQIKAIWNVRDHISMAPLKNGHVFKYDISLPHACLYDLVPLLRSRLQGSSSYKCMGFGHIGDGNIHVNVFGPEFSAEIQNLVEPYIFNWISQNKGSISAEHGLGIQKNNYIHFSKSPSAVNVMKALKKQFDPNLILNPYKVLPSEAYQEIQNA